MRVGMIDTQAIRQRWDTVGSKLDERGKRLFASGEVRAAGWGGLEAVHEITGLARSTIGRGLKDLDAAPLPKGRCDARVVAGDICRSGMELSLRICGVSSSRSRSVVRCDHCCR